MAKKILKRQEEHFQTHNEINNLHHNLMEETLSQNHAIMEINVKNLTVNINMATDQRINLKTQLINHKCKLDKTQ